MPNEQHMFRIWDNEFHEFVDPKENRYWIDPDGGVIVEYGPQCDDGISPMQYINVTKEPERYRVEPCIGLRDRNKRPIFMGDLCLLHGLRREIRWEDGGFGFQDYPPHADTDGYLFSETIPFTNHGHFAEIMANIEVVGTIHDGPDAGAVDPWGNKLPEGLKLWNRTTAEAR